MMSPISFREFRMKPAILGHEGRTLKSDHINRIGGPSEIPTRQTSCCIILIDIVKLRTASRDVDGHHVLVNVWPISLGGDGCISIGGCVGTCRPLVKLYHPVLKKHENKFVLPGHFSEIRYSAFVSLFSPTTAV